MGGAVPVARWILAATCSIAVLLTAVPAPAASASGPIVLGWSPGVAAGLPLDMPITVYFNRPMDQASLQTSWRLRPAASGVFSVSSTSITFRPRHPLKTGASYLLSLNNTAHSTTGSALVPFAARFTTGDALRVVHYSPFQGT
ncbi:MAG TPA: hypothetical protein DEV93_00120, partial [Chloroflexi bacterium]|nr:hypothetical protein [Chloroflexota bacterium]